MRIAVIDDEKYSRVALVRQIEGFLPHAEDRKSTRLNSSH